jgi:hypothetical protein
MYSNQKITCCCNYPLISQIPMLLFRSIPAPFPADFPPTVLQHPRTIPAPFPFSHPPTCALLPFNERCCNMSGLFPRPSLSLRRLPSNGVATSQHHSRALSLTSALLPFNVVATCQDYSRALPFPYANFPPTVLQHRPNYRTAPTPFPFSCADMRPTFPTPTSLQRCCNTPCALSFL